MQKLDNGISESLLNSFLDSTNGQAGSYARSESLKDFFNQALNGWLDYFCEEFNTNVGKEIAYLNGWKNVPKLCYHPIKNGVEIDKFASAISSLKSAQALNIGEDDEDAIREIIGLPERVYEEGDDKKDGEDGGDDMGDDDMGGKSPDDMMEETMKNAEMHKCGCGHAHDDLSKFQRTLISAQRAKHFSIPDFRSLVANKKSFTGSRELTTFEKKANL